MFCLNGHPISAGEQFCRVCGASVQGQPPPPQQFPQQVAVGPPPVPSRTGLWVVLGTVVVAAAAVAIVFMITSDNDDGGTAGTTLPPSSSTSQAPGAVVSSTPETTSPTSTTAPATSTTITTTTTTTTTLPGPVTVTQAVWETIEGGGLGGEGGQSIWDVVMIRGGYVAVGMSDAAVVWTSPDGVSWTPQTAPGLEGAHLLHLELAPDGTLVGVGHVLGTPLVFGAWTSPDGITWTPQAPPAGDMPPGTQQVHDFAAYPGGYVAVGLVSNNGDIDAAWWTSPDGLTWVARTISEPGVQQMLGVAVFEDRMVAAGENRPNAGIWRGPAGGNFRRMNDANLTTSVSDFDPSNSDARVFALDIAAAGPGFVAVGADQTTAGTSAGAVWTSPDGKEWTRFGNETEYTPNMHYANFAGNPTWTVMDTVVESNGTSIVVGRTGPPGDPDLMLWESPDGVTWRQSAVGILPGIQRAYNTVATNGKLIVVGITGAITQTPAADGAIWVATPDLDAPQVGTWREAPRFDSPASSYAGSAVVLEDQIIAVGQTSTNPLIWGSRDGIDWAQLPTPAAQPGQAIGLSGITLADGVVLLAGEDPDAAIWWSENLSTWTRAITPSVPGGDIDGIFMGSEQLIAFSSPGGQPLIWLSSDGRTWTDANVAQALGPGTFIAGVGEISSQLVLAVGTFAPSLQIWVSQDGNVWTRLPDDPAFDGIWPRFTTTFGDRLVISGNRDVTDLWSNTVISTSDLESWHHATILANPWLEYETNLGMSVVGSRLYLEGAAINADGDPTPALWSTGDLSFWTSADLLPTSGSAQDQFPLYGQLDHVVRIGDRLVAVGWSQRPGADWYATAWTSDNP